MTNKNTTYFDKCFMDVGSAFVTNTQSAKLMQPTQRPFDDPPRNAQPTAIFSSPFSKDRLDSLLTEFFTMRLRIVSSISLNTIGFLKRSTWFSSNRRDRFNQRQQLSHIMTIRPGQFDCKRGSYGICNDMVFRPHFPSIRWIRAGFRPPKTARTDAESTTAREKSIWSDSRSLLSKTVWILSHIPACCQSRSRRQQVIPEPHPISCGRYSQGRPVLSTNRIPVKASRLLTGGLPPLGQGFGSGKMGSMICHNSSDNSGLAMTLSSMTNTINLIFNHCFHRLFHYLKSRFC